MEPEISILVFDLIPFDEFSDSGEKVNNLDFAGDALVEFVRQLPDYFWRRVRANWSGRGYETLP